MSREIRIADAKAFTMSCAKNENARMSAMPYKVAVGCPAQYSQGQMYDFVSLATANPINPISSMRAFMVDRAVEGGDVLSTT